jgi:hypothetical protein
MIPRPEQGRDPEQFALRLPRLHRDTGTLIDGRHPLA